MSQKIGIPLPHNVILWLAGLKHISDLAATEAMSSTSPYFLDARFPTRTRVSPDHDPGSDEYLESWLEHTIMLVWHPAGSCKMGKIGDSSAVVDPQLRWGQLSTTILIHISYTKCLWYFYEFYPLRKQFLVKRFEYMYWKPDSSAQLTRSYPFLGWTDNPASVDEVM